MSSNNHQEGPCHPSDSEDQGSKGAEVDAPSAQQEEAAPPMANAHTNSKFHPNPTPIVGMLPWIFRHHPAGFGLAQL